MARRRRVTYAVGGKISFLKLPVVKVTWVDSQLLNPANGEFINPSALADVKPAQLELVGWLVRMDQDCIIVANEHDPETGEVKLIHVVPRCSIIKMERLRC